MNKVCNKCKSSDLSRPNAPYCRACRKKIDRAYYLKNKKLVRRKRNIDRQEFSKWLSSLKDNKKCRDCEKKFRYWILQWDHLPQYSKSFNISSSRTLIRSKKKVLEEIEKCELVCANCHANRTYSRLINKIIP